MGKGFLSPRSDLIFRLLFGDERSIEMLTDFLKSVLRIPHEDYDVLTIIDPHLLPEYKGGKLGIIDVKLKTKSGKILNIEIQVNPINRMENRIIYYDSKMVVEQIGTSEDYRKIKQVISIVITDYTLIKNSPEYHHRFTLYDPENSVEFTDIIEVHTLEMPKIPANADGTPLWVWMKFLDARTEEEMNMIAQKSPQVQKAVLRIMELSADERTRMLYEAREKERRDIVAREEYVHEEGRAEGRVEGRAEGEAMRAAAIAKNLISLNLPLDKIVAATGLTQNEVENLRNSD